MICNLCEPEQILYEGNLHIYCTLCFAYHGWFDDLYSNFIGIVISKNPLNVIEYCWEHNYFLFFHNKKEIYRLYYPSNEDEEPKFDEYKKIVFDVLVALKNNLIFE